MMKKAFTILILFLLVLSSLFSSKYVRNGYLEVYPDQLTGKSFHLQIDTKKKLMIIEPNPEASTIAMIGDKFGTVNMQIAPDGAIDYDSVFIFFSMNTEVNTVISSDKSTIISAASFLGLGDTFKEFCSGGYPIGSIGPAGGYVFYDKGFYSNGWRYLEAAPSDLRVLPDGMISVDKDNPVYVLGDYGFIWGYYRPTPDSEVEYINAGYDNFNIGQGEKNTSAIVNAMGERAYMNGDIKYDYESQGTTNCYAANLCWKLVYNGYDDWFLPSKLELDELFNNLKSTGFGNLYNGFYWSSSENGAASTAVIVSSETGAISNGVRGSNRFRIRPIRAF